MFEQEETDAVRKYLEGHVIKILLLGQHGTGTDSILMRLIWDYPEIPTVFDPTTEEPVYNKQLRFGRIPVLLEGQTCEYSGNTAMPAGMGREFEAHMYVFSVGDRASFELLPKMHAELGGPRPGGIPHCLFVVANKTDIPFESWEVSMQEAKEFSRSIGAELLAMSAKTGKGCGKEDARTLATRVLLSRIKGEEENANVQSAQKPADSAIKSRGGALEKITQLFKGYRKRGDGESS